MRTVQGQVYGISGRVITPSKGTKGSSLVPPLSPPLSPGTSGVLSVELPGPGCVPGSSGGCSVGPSGLTVLSPSDGGVNHSPGLKSIRGFPVEEDPDVLPFSPEEVEEPDELPLSPEEVVEPLSSVLPEGVVVLIAFHAISAAC